jgi:hypothetical protein
MSQNSVSRRWINTLLESSDDIHKIYALLDMLGPDLIKEGSTLFRDASGRKERYFRSESQTELPDTVPSGADT